MKKAIILALMLCLLFVSCDDAIVIENGSSQEVFSEQSSTGYEYILNTSTLKYHAQFCPRVDSIKEENRKTTTDIDIYIEIGYSPCGSCILR